MNILSDVSGKRAGEADKDDGQVAVIWTALSSAISSNPAKRSCG